MNSKRTLCIFSPLPPKYSRTVVNRENNGVMRYCETGFPPVPLKVNVPTAVPSVNTVTEVCASYDRLLEAVTVTL